MTELNFNLVETVAFATAILWLGMFLRKRIFFLSKYNIPAPVIGGVIFALASWALKDSFSFNFDMVVKDPLMITFFTSIGLAASFKMLKQGGPQVFIFLIVASVLVLLQNVVAVVLSYATGIHPLLGMLAGSITMSGGHGTGAVYANLFEKQYGLAGGMELAMAAATFGLVMGSILGGPVARRLIERNRLSKSHLNPDEMTYETVDETLDPASDGPVSASVLMTTLMHGRKSQRVQREIILCIDQSGSMASSVVYSSIFGAVMASMPAVKTHLVVFDTAVVDMTEQLDDPVDLLFGVQLGGGTDINRAVGYCQSLIRAPRNTILVLISDLDEGGVEKNLLQRANELVQSGVQVITLLALSNEGTPFYDKALAAKLAGLGIPSFACTPDLFPGMMAAAIRKEDVNLWAAKQGIVVPKG